MPAPTPTELSIIYVGTGISGRTCSMTYVQRRLPNATPMRCVSGNCGFSVETHALRLTVSASPGAVMDNTARDALAATADGFVFVVDSQIERQEAVEYHLRWFEGLRANRPVVFQFNKRDLPNVVLEEELSRRINPSRAPEVSSIASKGTGVWEAFEQAARLGARRRGCEALLLELLQSATGPSPTR